MRDATAFRRDLLRWFRANGRDLPWRRTRDPYAVFVAEVMLQQTQVATVIPYFEKWMRRFPTSSALAVASTDDVLHAWQGLGYYRRARNLHAAARAIEGAFPRDIEAIRRLPGVGKYTANAIATFAFDRSVPVVEANTARVLSRLFDIRLPIDSSAGTAAVWIAAAALVPATGAREHNSALMDLGALVCTARAPRCSECALRTHCRAIDPERLPVKQPRATMIALTEVHAFARAEDRVLLRQSHSRWNGMWILPPHRGTIGAPIHESVFPFTHHRITLRVFRTRRLTPRRDERWVSVADLHSVAMPSPHRRAVEALLAKSCSTKPAA